MFPDQATALDAVIDLVLRQPATASMLAGDERMLAFGQANDLYVG